MLDPLIETLYFESGSCRIRVDCSDSGFMWFSGQANYNDEGLQEYHGVDDTLTECLEFAAESLLEPGSPKFVLSRDQFTSLPNF